MLLVLAAAPSSAQPTCSPRALCTADQDGDGLVGLADWGQVASEFGKPPAAGSRTDIDGDGVVSLGDLALLSLQFGMSCNVECPPNQPLDFDGDGAYDYIACGDYDGDGRLTMELGCVNADPSTRCDADGDKGDLLACLELLDDPDGRILDILPGRYEVPDPPFTAHHGPSSGSQAGILQIPSNTRVNCRTGAVLTGTDERHLDKTDQISVIYALDDSTGVVIENCEVDGDWPDGYDCGGDACINHARMGIYLKGEGNLVRGNYVHHTRHSCIYTKDGSHNTIASNRLDWCGGSWSVSQDIPSYPGVYVYSNGGHPVEGVNILHTECDRTRAPCINTRRSTDSDQNRISDLFVLGTRHIATGPNANGAAPECMRLRGLDGARIEDTHCENTAGLHLNQGAARYLDDPQCSVANGNRADCVKANRNVVIADALVLDSVGGNPLELGGWNAEIHVSNVTVRGAPTDRRCVTGIGPFRGLVLDGLVVEDCGKGGLKFGLDSTGPSWGEQDAAEALVIRNVEVRTADRDLTDNARGTGVALLRGCVGCVFENLLIKGWSQFGLEVGGGQSFSDNRLTGIDLEQMGSWYQGSGQFASLPPCDPSISGRVHTVVDASTTSACDGAGDQSNLCVCDGVAWRDTDVVAATLEASYGIDLLGAGAADANEFIGITCTNARARTHCIQLGANARFNLLSDVLARDTRGLQQWNVDAPDANNGAIDLNGASDNSLEDVVCENLRNDEIQAGRRCVCLDAACEG